MDDGWKLVEMEPETVSVNSNGHHANGIGNDHDEGLEPQQLLFSWAELMAEELLKPKARSRKSKTTSASLFEWALKFEQKREAEEPVDAGRLADIQTGKGIANEAMPFPSGSCIRPFLRLREESDARANRQKDPEAMNS